MGFLTRRHSTNKQQKMVKFNCIGKNSEVVANHLLVEHAKCAPYVLVSAKVHFKGKSSYSSLNKWCTSTQSITFSSNVPTLKVLQSGSVGGGVNCGPAISVMLSCRNRW